MLEVICFNKISKTAWPIEAEQVSKSLKDDNNLVWLDFNYPEGAKPSAEEIDILENTLGIRPPNISKCILDQRIPEHNEYENYIMVIIFAFEQEENYGVKFLDLILFLGKNFVVTYQHEKISEIEHIKRTSQIKADRSVNSASGLFHLIAAHIVDNYLTVIDNIGIGLDKIEESLFSKTKNLNLETVSKYRERINEIRRIIILENQIFNTMRREYRFKGSEEEKAYFIDLYDHLEKCIAELSALKEKISGILEIQTSLNGEKLNGIIKFLTIISTILLLDNLMVAIFAPNLPKVHPFDTLLGFYIVFGLMFLIAIGMILFFRVKRWV